MNSARKNWLDLFVFSLRAVLGFLVLFDLLRGNIFNAAFYGCIWFVAYIFSLLGRDHEHYGALDALILAFFILSWNAPGMGMQMESSVFGLDKVFHATGGALLALVGLAIAATWVQDLRARAVAAVVFALAIGGGWEVFEWIFHVIRPEFMPTTYGDSMLDLVADTIGAIVVSCVWLFWRHRKRT